MHQVQKPKQFTPKAAPRLGRQTTNRQSANARSRNRKDEAYARLAPTAKLNLDARQQPTTNFAYMDLAGYPLRVTGEALAKFQRITAGQASEEEWQDFLIADAEARFGGEWIPLHEAMRLDDEAAQLQEAV